MDLKAREIKSMKRRQSVTSQKDALLSVCGRTASMFIFWSVLNPVPSVATTMSCVCQILFSCADTPAWPLGHMDHCRYPSQKRTGRPPYAGLQEIPTSFRVPRDWKDPSSEAASAHIDQRRIFCHSLHSPGSSSNQLSGGILPWPQGWHHPRTL